MLRGTNLFRPPHSVAVDLHAVDEVVVEHCPGIGLRHIAYALKVVIDWVVDVDTPQSRGYQSLVGCYVEVGYEVLGKRFRVGGVVDITLYHIGARVITIEPEVG